MNWRSEQPELMKKWTEFPIVQYAHQYTLFNQLGELTGKSILDIGCADGFFTRKFKQKGAAQVIGVDIAERMIELAKEEETRKPLGIEYIVGDVLEIGKIGSFDIVICNFVFSCLPTKEKVLKACQTISTNLKPGGRFVGLNYNVKQVADSYPICEKYGYTANVSGSTQDGESILNALIIDGQKLSGYDYYFSKKTYEWAFQTAGLKETYWPKMVISPEGIEQLGKEFWQGYLDFQMDFCIECVK